MSTTPPATTTTTTPMRHPMYAAAPDPDTPRQALVRRCHQGHPLVTVAELRQQDDGTWTTHILERAGFVGLLPGELGPALSWRAAAEQLAVWSGNRVRITG